MHSRAVSLSLAVPQVCSMPMHTGHNRLIIKMGFFELSVPYPIYTPIFLTAYPAYGPGQLEPIPADTGREAGDTLDPNLCPSLTCQTA